MTALGPWPYSFPMKPPPFYDGLGGLVALVLLSAVIIYPLCGHEIPQLLESTFAAAIGWVFRGGVGVANDFIHQKRSTPNGSPGSTGPASPGSQ